MRGFAGKSVERFFTNTGEALNAAGKAHSQDPFEGMSSNHVPFPNIPAPRQPQVPFSPEDAWASANQTRNVGNASNVVVDPQVYKEVLRRVEMIDEHAGADVYMIANAIEEMCAKIFVVPETVSRILAITGQVKASLGRFRALTGDTEINMSRFMNAMSDIDHGNTGLLAISTQGAEQAMNRVAVSFNRQLDSMESTSNSYRSQSASLLGQAHVQEQRANSFWFGPPPQSPSRFTR